MNAEGDAVDTLDQKRPVPQALRIGPVFGVLSHGSVLCGQAAAGFVFVR